MKRYKAWNWALFLALLTAAVATLAQQPATMRIKAPELREIETWINSKPLKLAKLRGRVVVLHFWTFG